MLDAIAACRFRDRIRTIDTVMTDDEVKNLVRVCDCFVSLHRSEGFGRGMAEALCLGKPVSATGYSGNLDFMSAETSYLVDHTLIPVKPGEYPEPDGQHWADANVAHATEYMHRLAT